MAEETPKTEEEVPKSKKKLVIFGLLGFSLVIGGGVSAFMILSGGKQESRARTHDESDPLADEELMDSASQVTHSQSEQKKEDAPQAPVAETKTAAVEQDSMDFGETFTLEPFHLNLGNPLENRYIRLEVALEYRDPSQKEELTRRLPQLRDAILAVTSQKSREFLLSPDGKDQLRRELKIRINQYMNKPIQSVFITDMLIE